MPSRGAMADARCQNTPSSICTSTRTCTRCKIRGVARRQVICIIYVQCNVYKSKILEIQSPLSVSTSPRSLDKCPPLCQQQVVTASPDQDDWLETLKSLDGDWPDNRLGAGWRQLGAARRLRQRKMAMGKFYVGCGFVRRPCCEIHNILPSPTRRGPFDNYNAFLSHSIADTPATPCRLF